MHCIQRQSLGSAAALALTLICAMIASAQSTKPVPDLKSIAGTWKGTGHSPTGTNPLEWTIKEDGTVEVIVGAAGAARRGVAKMSIKDGQLFYESGTSSGSVTLEENSGRRVLKYEAVFKRDNSRGGAELTPAR
jgi:hypothetical protein